MLRFTTDSGPTKKLWGPCSLYTSIAVVVFMPLNVAENVFSADRSSLLYLTNNALMWTTMRSS